MQYPARSEARPSARRRLVAIAAGVLAVTVGSTAYAQEADQDEEDEPFVFEGRGIYAGGGAGVIPQIDAAAGSFRIQAVFPVHSLVGLEIASFAYRFTTPDHHGDDVEADALGIGTGVRFNAPPSWVARPYVAARFQHLHFFPDPWGDHDPTAGGGSDEHDSHHRWGGAGAIGVDAGLFGPQARWRGGVEGELATMTGPGVDAVVQVVAMLGVGF